MLPIQDGQEETRGGLEKGDKGDDEGINQLEVEAGLEAEGWTEVNGGARPKGSGGLPRLVEGA